MRYYLYLDKNFLKVLFSANDRVNFNIEVFEFSIKKNNSVNNSIRLEPRMEKICDDENMRKDDKKDNKRGNIKKDAVCASYGLDTSQSEQTERRYINIEDITDIKNNNFYHTLIEKMNKSNTNNDKSDNRVVIKTGFIRKYENNIYGIEQNEKNGFFIIDNAIVWFDKNLLISDIDLLLRMSCKVTVVGYIMNCLEIKNVTFIKAIAIYIS